MRRSARSTRSSPNWPCARFRSSRRLRAAARPCTASPTSAMRSIRNAAAALPSSRIVRRSNGSAVSSDASTASARRAVSRAAVARRRELWRRAARAGCWRTVSSRRTWLPRWESVAAQAVERVRHCYERAGAVRNIRLHGDCHAGNVLWRPTVRAGRTSSISTIAAADPRYRICGCCCRATATTCDASCEPYLAGYEDFCDFDDRELHLIEALRTLRLIHYSAWLARRWDDPAFPAAFPWFNTQRYWQDRDSGAARADRGDGRAAVVDLARNRPAARRGAVRFRPAGRGRACNGRARGLSPPTPSARRRAGARFDRCAPPDRDRALRSRGSCPRCD